MDKRDSGDAVTLTISIARQCDISDPTCRPWFSFLSILRVRWNE